MFSYFEVRYEALKTNPQSTWDMNVVWTTYEGAAVYGETRCVKLASGVKRLAGPNDHTSKSFCCAWSGWKEGVDSMPVKSVPFRVWKAGVGGLDASKE